MHIFGNKSTSPSYALLDALFYCTIASTNFAIELTMILYHPYLRRNFLSLFFKIKSLIFKIKSSTNSKIGPSTLPPTNAYFYKGFSLQNEAKTKLDGNETDKHFEQLKRTWEITEKTKIRK
uniref:G_PROTEIN_RECEP_F1_2 domain-containing protein n=1 Tax=Meloidogyne hapla TaxID=6305 RepID=A0A1I8BED0_MELHA